MCVNNVWWWITLGRHVSENLVVFYSNYCDTFFNEITIPFCCFDFQLLVLDFSSVK